MSTTYTWKGLAGGNWNKSANWTGGTGGGVPRLATDIAVFPINTGNTSVLIDLLIYHVL
jgi:hypothetical protein